MTKTLAPAKTPGVAIARVLRGLGLKQGSDFRVKGEYKGGERIGTRVAAFSRTATQTVADNADSIEQLAAEAGYHFNVSVYFTPSGTVWVHVANYGQRTRQTHFLSTSGRTTNTATEAPQPAEQPEPKPVIRATLGAPRPAFGTPARTLDEYLSERRSGKSLDTMNRTVAEWPEGQRVQGVDSYGVTCMGTVNGAGWGAVTVPSHENYGRTWVDVTWDEMPHNRGTGRRNRPFTSDLIKH